MNGLSKTIATCIRRPESPPLEPDDITNAKAAREAARLKRDEYIVKSDLEDADQRNPLPDMKDQE